MNPAIVALARAIRAALPWITLSEALTYADASTVQGRAFRSRSGWFGLGHTRDALIWGHAWFAILYGPNDSGRVQGGRIRARLGCGATLEKEDPEVKRAYGAIVASRHPAMVAWERYARRCKRAARECPPWPGTRNMRPAGSENATIRAWVASQGLAGVCEAYAPDGRAYVTIPGVHS